MEHMFIYFLGSTFCRTIKVAKKIKIMGMIGKIGGETK